MATTLQKPKTAESPRVLWTIHKHPGMVYTVHKNDKTAIVSFCKKKDCDFFTKALDTYHMTHGVYPQISKNLQMYGTVDTESLLNQDFWVEMDLHRICIQEFFNLWIVDEIKTDKNVFSLNGKVVCFDNYNINYTIGYLSSKWELT